MDKKEVLQIKSLALAYMGDVVYEHYVRDRLIRRGKVNVHVLHQTAVLYVQAKQQTKALRYLIEAALLTEEELSVVRRGRNAKVSSVPKHTDVMTYRYSTAFEALLGYYYFIKDDERLSFLLETAVGYLEKEVNLS